MLSKKTGFTVIGGLGGFALLAGIVLAAFQVQGEMMWPWAFQTIVIVSLVAMCLVALFLAALAVERVVGWLRPYGWQKPWYRLGAHPLQEMLDLDAAHCGSPHSFIHICRQEILDRRFEPEQERPYIVFYVHGYNGCSRPILIGPASGVTTYHGSPLRDGIYQGPNPGQTRVPANGKFSLGMMQYVDRDVATRIATDLSGLSLTRGLFSIQARCDLWLDGEEATDPFPLWLAGDDTFLIVTVRP